MSKSNRNRNRRNRNKSRNNQNKGVKHTPQDANEVKPKIDSQSEQLDANSTGTLGSSATSPADTSATPVDSASATASTLKMSSTSATVDSASISGETPETAETASTDSKTAQNSPASEAQSTSTETASTSSAKRGTTSSASGAKDTVKTDIVNNGNHNIDKDYHGNNDPKRGAEIEMEQAELEAKARAKEQSNQEVNSTTKEPKDDHLEKESSNSEAIGTVEKKEKSNSTKKQWIASVCGVALLVAGIGLGYGFGFANATTSKSSTPVAVTAKKTEIKYKDLMPLLDSSEQVRNLTQQYIAGTVFEKNYGNLVSNEKVDASIAEVKAQYGQSYANILSQSGFTPKSFKEYTRQSMIMKAFVEKQIKIPESTLKNDFKKFVPNQTINIGTFTKKSDAEGYAKNPKSDKYSKQVQSLVLGTNHNTQGLSEKLVQAAYNTKEGKASDVISQQGKTETIYVVIVPTKHVDRGTDYKKYRSELINAEKETKLKDTNYNASVIKKELTNLGVKFSDNDLQKIVETAFKTNQTSAGQDQTNE